MEGVICSMEGVIYKGYETMWVYLRFRIARRTHVSHLTHRTLLAQHGTETVVCSRFLTPRRARGLRGNVLVRD